MSSPRVRPVRSEVTEFDRVREHFGQMENDGRTIVTDFARFRDDGQAIGPPGRSHRGHDSPASSRTSVTASTRSFVMPIGDATTCGALQFVTPNLTLATEFSALFVAIAETVMLFTPDMETEIATLRP